MCSFKHKSYKVTAETVKLIFKNIYGNTLVNTENKQKTEEENRNFL